MKTLRTLYFPTMEAGRKALEAIADFLLENEVPQEGPFMNPSRMPLEHDEPVQEQRKSIFEDVMDQWESEIPGGFRVGHPVHLAEPKEPLSDDVLIFRRRAEGPVDCNPYYHMQKLYLGDKPHAGDLDRVPITTPWLFIQGMESIHVQPQYEGTPGYWVIINCKRTPEGVELLEALDTMFSREITQTPALSAQLLEQFPPDQLNTVEGIAHLMAAEDYGFYADTLFQILQLLAQIRPQEFRGELIYVWEELMRHYTTLDELDKAVICLETQAALDPASSDPWLNLGFVYNAFGHSGKALETYLEGVRRFPEDEYLHHNLASLLLDLGHHAKALGFLNEAILANPDRAVNYKLKGDIHIRRKELQAATNAYRQAVSLMQDEAEWFKEQCVSCLARCLENQDKSDHAAALWSAFQAGNDLSTVLRHLDKDLLAFFPTEGRSIKEIEAMLMKVVPLITSTYLDFFTEKDILPLNTYSDVTGRILVLRPEALKHEYQKPVNQLWRCHGGTGARRRSKGSNLNAQRFVDGQKAGWNRNRWLGVLKIECIPKAESLLGMELVPVE